MLEAESLCKYYGSHMALTDVSFRVDRGETVGFLGLNGAGKSTVMRILTGFLAPTLGRAAVMGGDPALPQTRQRFGYLPESNPLPMRMRVKEYLEFRARIKGLGRGSAKAAAWAAERTGVAHVYGDLVGSLSKGYRQRVGIADSIVASPEILILDEPTAGLDPGQADDTRGLLGELAKNSTILLSSHILHDVERLCGRVIVIDRGRVVADGATRKLCEENVDERAIAMEVMAGEPVREALRGLPGVKTVSVGEAAGPEGATPVRITTPAGVDLRREISALCARRGWLVAEMHLEPVRLEDIFRRLTKAG